ncbi:hypothetical protein B0T25DRAFT_581897 [Lasiosphaeria hispida]|uniref:Nephrocystin 3-like N-terminal domain-containing protein n=1 Tax=Lasiosphaeria hispida TaxID=260671 RepID=A0AAJ0MC51_9PEZI|nr:hypothetical protein B0T25DRAFT_581897 [Lasiosphaeria hispida]
MQIISFAHETYNVVKAVSRDGSPDGNISSAATEMSGRSKKKRIVAGQVLRWWTHRSKLRALQRDLEEIRQKMEATVLGDLWLSKEAPAIQHGANFSSLDKTLQSFIQHYSEGARTLETLLRTEAAAAKKTIVEESSKTRKDPDYASSISAVKVPYPKTFAWIFDDNISGWHSFSSWLKSDQDWIYWISGKAGSGKSTLMKFIIDNHDSTGHGTVTRLRYILGDDALVVSFFLWAIGTKEQRTMRGILCGLLHDILQSQPSSISWLLEQTPALGTKRYSGDWFEDEGYGRMMELVKSLLTRTSAKLCLASRPEPVLRDVYSKYPMLQLQDLNASDIRIYVQEYLHDHFQYLDKVPGALHDRKIIVELFRRANDHKDTYEQIWERIRQCPDELERLYETSWKRHGAETIYRQEAAGYFKPVLAFSQSRLSQYPGPPTHGVPSLLELAIDSNSDI